MRTRPTLARWLAPAALLVALGPALVACGDDGDDDGADAPTSEATSSQEPTASDSAAEGTEQPSASATSKPPAEASSQPPAARDVPHPCDVVTAADVTDAYGITFTEDGVSSATTQQQNIEWTSKGCTFEADDVAEVKVELAGPADFTKGRFQCLAPSDITGVVTPIDVAGATSAWWKTNEAPPLEAILRACTNRVIVEIDLEYEDGVDYEGDPQNQTAALMETVLGNL